MMATKQIMLVKSDRYERRYEIKKELRERCKELGIKVPTKLEDVPEDLRPNFEMVSPDFYV